MKAMVVEPGRAGSAAVGEVQGPVGAGTVLVEGVAVGICGTDIEIATGQYGTAPPGAPHLVLGHESLGRVLQAPEGARVAVGDLVAGIVRRPDPVPCHPCSVGAWDMCRNGRYTERGIKDLDGYGAEQWWVEPEFVVKVDPELGLAGVLTEPASVVAKAWDQVERISTRSPVVPRRALITGAGPIGLLAALLGRQRDLEVHVLDRATDGPKPDLVTELGATYHSGSIEDVPEADVIIECTGASPLILDVIRHNRPAGIVCLAGVSSAGATTPVDLGDLNRRIVLENDLVFGSVNANRAHYEAAAKALALADQQWLSRLITRRVPLASWPEALTRAVDDVKVVVELGGRLTAP